MPWNIVLNQRKLLNLHSSRPNKIFLSFSTKTQPVEMRDGQYADSNIYNVTWSAKTTDRHMTLNWTHNKFF